MDTAEEAFSSGARQWFRSSLPNFSHGFAAVRGFVQKIFVFFVLILRPGPL